MQAARHRRIPLLPDDLHQHPLAPSPVELTVEDLFPWAKVQFAFGDGDHHFAAHDLPFHVGVGIVLSRAVVLVLGRRRVRCQFSSQTS
jgi:hypothetical protein